MNQKRNFGAYLGVFASILAIVALILYNQVMYKMPAVRIMLIAAAVVGVLQLLLAGFAPRIAAYFPICQAALLMSAAVWGTNLMVNQIAYVYAGLDPMSTILGWILYIAFVVVAGIISLVAAFWRVNPKKA